jgi:hypothetical protein
MLSVARNDGEIGGLANVFEGGSWPGWLNARGSHRADHLLHRKVCSRASSISWLTWCPVPQNTNGIASWQHFAAAWSRASWTAMAQSTRGDPRQPQLHLPCARTRLRTTTATPAFSVSSRPWSSPSGRSTMPTASSARRILMSACLGSMSAHRHRVPSAKVTRGDPARGFMILPGNPVSVTG